MSVNSQRNRMFNNKKRTDGTMKAMCISLAPSEAAVMRNALAPRGMHNFTHSVKKKEKEGKK